MRRTPLLALAAAVALAAAGCAKSACQELGEKLCNCQPAMTIDACKTQVTDQLNEIGVGNPGFGGMLQNAQAGQQGPLTFEEYCQERLDACTGAQTDSGATDFCQFLTTTAGQDACGLSPANPPP